MARTTILPTDAAARKVWSAKVAIDTKKKSFWDKMTGTEADALPVVAKTDLESGPGDEVTTTLIAKLRGKPIEGSEKAEGREKSLAHYTQKMRIDKHRQPVNVGDVMTQKRVGFSISEQVRARLSDYMAEINDEQAHMTACGSRGDGDEIQHYPVGYAGFPNAFILLGLCVAFIMIMMKLFKVGLTDIAAGWATWDELIADARALASALRAVARVNAALRVSTRSANCPRNSRDFASGLDSRVCIRVRASS